MFGRYFTQPLESLNLHALISWTNRPLLCLVWSLAAILVIPVIRVARVTLIVATVSLSISIHVVVD